MLAARDGDLKPLRQVFVGTPRTVNWKLVRNVSEASTELAAGGVDAVIFTASASHLHLAQTLAEVRTRDPLLPVILVVRAGDAAPIVKAVSAGVNGVIFTEVLSLLPTTLEREILLARDHAQLQRRLALTEKVNAAVERAPVALALADPQGLVQWANAAYLALAGISAADVAAATVSLWGGAAGPEPEAWATLRAGQVWRGSIAASGGGGETNLHQLAVVLVGADAGSKPWYVAVRRSPEGEPAPTGAASVPTQRSELFAAIAGGIAHDLNNILAPITMAANLLHEQCLETESNELVETIETSAERGAAVIKQVLAFSNGSENCALLLQPRLVVREVARLAAAVFPPNIGVRAEVPGELWPIIGDPGEIHQAIINVLVNARDAMPEGGHVALSARNAQVRAVPNTPFFSAQPGEFVEIAIDDTGPGLDPHVASRVWEPFVTTKGTGQGAGLGLSRVAGVLRSHNGFALFKSRPGRGTSVKLYFPRAAATVVRVPAVTEPAPRAFGRILVVDDEHTILDLSRRILERAGYEVLLASEGREALSLFARHRAEIGLVLTDLAMPGMNGFTLVWALRRSKPDLRVMVATGQGSEANLRELERMGVRQVLLKPFTSRRLLEAVAQALAEPVTCEPDLFLGEVAVNGR